MIDLRNLSCKEKQTIEEFRMRVEKDLDPILLQHEEVIYYKFLKARDFNIEKAEKMLRKHIIWRKANQVNALLEDFVPSEVFLKFIEPYFFGTDEKGDFILYVPGGRLDPRDILQCIKVNDFMDSFIWYMERMLSKAVNLPKRGKALKTHVQGVIIFDLHQLTFSTATNKISVEFMLGLVHTLLDNYPESMSSVYVINAPRYYVIPFAILKTVLSNAMLQKISIFGKDGWKEELLKSIHADVLPAFLGGNRTDPDGDPLCKTFVNHEHIPVAYYSLSDDERYFKDKTQIQTLVIPNNSRKEVDVDVTEEGSVIQWEFFIKNKDIGIGLFHRDEDLTEILPVMRCYTTDGTRSLSYRTKIAGKYILVFDNSYSWMKSKEVEYTIKVVKPGK